MHIIEQHVLVVTFKKRGNTHKKTNLNHHNSNNRTEDNIVVTKLTAPVLDYCDFP